MSGIISDSNLLKLEEDRVTLRNNLRSQGIACSDDETLESLIDKVEDVQSFEKYLDKTISGDIFTSSTEHIFQNCSNVTGLYLYEIQSLSLNRYTNMSKLKRFYSAKATSVTQASVYNDGLLELVSVPSLVGVPSTNQSINAGNAIVVDLGKIDTVNTGTPMNKPNFKHFVSRKTDGISSLASTSVFNSNIPFIAFVPQALISNYESATNWSALASATFKSLEGSRYEETTWLLDIGTHNCKCTLDGNEIDVVSYETVAIFKHTENISHCYENGVELQDTDLVKGRTLTSTI